VRVTGGLHFAAIVAASGDSTGRRAADLTAREEKKGRHKVGPYESRSMRRLGIEPRTY
jgi:hypothetical protein